jgi:hypothetical protein
VKYFLCIAFGFAFGCLHMFDPRAKEVVIKDSFNSGKPQIAEIADIDRFKDGYRSGSLFGFYCGMKGMSYEQMTNVIESAWIALEMQKVNLESRQKN